MDDDNPRPSAQPSQGKPARRVKGPREDAWLRTVFDDPDFDRNRLDSLRRCRLNPDFVQRRAFSCFCGNEVNLNTSWYVMADDGTLVCNACAQCNCCGSEAYPNSRRLVCIDGMVLCYRCVKYFGYRHQTILRARVERLTAMKNPLGLRSKAAQGSAAEKLVISNRSNCEYYDYNVPRVDRRCFVPKEDQRRQLRKRFYDQPVERLAHDDNPYVVEPAYLAENSHMPAMLCPACNTHARGPSSFVVPSMARVYHRKCFHCCNCRNSLSRGYKLVVTHFQYCSCEVPQVWCTRIACQMVRHAHHKVSKCRLGCVRPGGRLQIDIVSEEADQSPLTSGGKLSSKLGSATGRVGGSNTSLSSSPAVGNRQQGTESEEHT